MTVCNCACSVCMAGYCCMEPNRQTPVQPSVTWPAWPPSVLPSWSWVSSNPAMWPTDKNGNPLVGYWECKCGTVVPPGVEHRCPERDAKPDAYRPDPDPDLVGTNYVPVKRKKR